MRETTKLVSFRLSAEAFQTLQQIAKKGGESPGGAAREFVLNGIAQARNNQHQVEALWKEVHVLRSELALATEAVLTVLATTEAEQLKASAWVRNHLNR